MDAGMKLGVNLVVNSEVIFGVNVFDFTYFL